MIVTADNLTHRYAQRMALAGLSFGVKQGEIFGILGPNGGGKSTLFGILSTMIEPAGGRAAVCGYDVSQNPSQVRRSIGVVFQSHSLDRKLTVAENLHAQGRFFGLSGATLRQRTDELLERFRLSDRRRDLVESLSGGLKRRVEIAKALLHSPPVLLMDEPSTGIDPGARRELWNYVTDLRETRGTTILLTTHLLDEADGCDRILFLHEGRKVAEGTPAELKSRIGGDVVLFETAEPVSFAKSLSERYSVATRVVDNAVRVEVPDGLRFMTDVAGAFPGVIRSVNMHKPTLEDVFLDETGVRIDG